MLVSGCLLIAFALATTSRGADESQRPLILRSNLPPDEALNSASSLESFLRYSNLTPSEMNELQNKFDRASLQLYRQLSSPDLAGATKHAIHCQHRLDYGRHPFLCRNCWSYLPICLCRAVGNRILLQQDTQVLLWTHHKEWGSPSNTGSILPLVMSNTHMLIKGLSEHDCIVLQNDTSGLETVVLWTGDGIITDDTPAVAVEQLWGKPIRLIAIEGTWRNARRMVSALPSHYLSLALTREQIDMVCSSRGDADGLHSPSSSVLHRLRRSKASTTKVCTAQAVVCALVALRRVSVEQGRQILDLVNVKVESTARYQGKMTR